MGQKNISKEEHYNLLIVYCAKAAAKVHFGKKTGISGVFCFIVILRSKLREQIKWKEIEPLLREGF